MQQASARAARPESANSPIATATLRIFLRASRPPGESTDEGVYSRGGSGGSIMIRVVGALAALAFVGGVALAGDRITGAPFATRSEVIAQHGMAATSQPLATQIAVEVLKQGGSAVDAAIAANAALGLMEPT